MECPKGCGWEGSPAEYAGHFNVCPARTGNRIDPLSSYMLVAPLKKMQEICRRRNFEEFLKAGMEVLIDIGKFYEMAGIIGLETLFNSVAIALLSAYKNDWRTAAEQIQIALMQTERGIETK